ncbi:glycosyltransferase [Mycolicibacterium sp. D5.8-2]|uniref:glycosyltransferase family 4 protein n=1 Tax=Mycolicibacterium sp. D5.8-2 TaxID=3085903 RepID=UPI00298D3DD4|nr:glycosyltransferase [Mycolicibacterium sp. D5.8-2]MDW5615076.1 glycosyltransferase [Mycolicibacterium sp. D5.8-2]
MGIRKLADHAITFPLLALKILTCKRQSILHLTGLRGVFLYPELVLVFLAKLRNCSVIYDMRAGITESIYRNRTAIYRSCLGLLLRSVDLVFVEGENQIPFVASLTGYDPIYLPNHVELASLPPRSRSNASDSQLIIAYAGHIKPEKGISTILETAELLEQQGFDVVVRIAGAGIATFIDSLRSRYIDLDIEWLGTQPSDRVLEVFSESHFFLFPTQWWGEGQSNALTEAMACGCVPVVSDHGFNVPTVGDCGAILTPTASPADYAAAVQQIWNSGLWEELSRRSARRVHERFSSAVVIDRLVEQYTRLECGDRNDDSRAIHDAR